jgi:hypothetical protein
MSRVKQALILAVTIGGFDFLLENSIENDLVTFCGWNMPAEDFYAYRLGLGAAAAIVAVIFAIAFLRRRAAEQEALIGRLEKQGQELSAIRAALRQTANAVQASQHDKAVLDEISEEIRALDGQIVSAFELVIAGRPVATDHFEKQAARLATWLRTGRRPLARSELARHHLMRSLPPRPAPLAQPRDGRSAPMTFTVVPQVNSPKPGEEEFVPEDTPWPDE